MNITRNPFSFIPDDVLIIILQFAKNIYDVERLHVALVQKRWLGLVRKVFRPLLCFKYACHFNMIKLQDYLLEDNNLEICTEKSLYWICKMGYVKVFDKLVNSSNTFIKTLASNYISRIGTDLLITAIRGSKIGIVKRLLKFKNPRIEISESSNYVIVDTCTAYMPMGIILELLKDERFDPSAKNNDMLITACDIGQVDMVKVLLNHKKVDPSAQNNKALNLAAGNRSCELQSDGSVSFGQLTSGTIYLEIVKLLLKDPRVDPTDKNYEAVKYAVQYKDVKMLRLFFNHPKVDPTFNSNFIIKSLRHSYSVGRNINMFRFLLKNPKINPKNMEPLVYAIKHKYPTMALYFLKQNIHTRKEKIEYLKLAFEKPCDTIINNLLNDLEINPHQYGNYQLMNMMMKMYQIDFEKLLLTRDV